MVNQETISQSSNKKPIRLGIWGLPNSGKTVYMTMLYHYLSQGESQWRIVTDDEVTEKYVNDNLALIMDQGDFPDPTEVTIKVEVCSYKLINDTKNKIVELSFFDVSGEVYL
jgi:GTPase SAR1 family protein